MDVEFGNGQGSVACGCSLIAGGRTFRDFPGQGLYDKFSFQVELTPHEVEVMGEFAYVVDQVKGNLTPKRGGTANLIHLPIGWLLKKQTNACQTFRQLWNNNPIDV